MIAQAPILLQLLPPDAIVASTPPTLLIPFFKNNDRDRP